MADLATAITAFLDPATLVTDAGSVKATVVAELGPILGPRFVGAHPIAGSERSGLAAARADLFEAAPCVVTPTPTSDPTAVAAVTTFWQSVGCVVSTLTPAAHDAALARTSHLPHLTASALVAAVTSSSPDAMSLVGPGFRDCTRVAMGNADLWTGILLANRAAVASSVAELREILQNVETMLTTGNEESLRHFLKSAADARLAAPVPSTHAVQGQ
jgi:prephenate dehydrogenase